MTPVVHRLREVRLDPRTHQVGLLVGGCLLLGAAVLPWVAFNPQSQRGPTGAYLPIAVRYVGPAHASGLLGWSASGPGAVPRLLLAAGGGLAIAGSVRYAQAMGATALASTVSAVALAALNHPPIPAPPPYDRFWHLQAGVWCGAAGLLLLLAALELTAAVSRARAAAPPGSPGG